MNNALDQPFLLQVTDGDTGKTAVDFEPLNEDTLADETEGRHFLKNTVVGGLVKNNGVLGLVLDFSLGPLLLLCGFTTARRCCGFCFGLYYACQHIQMKVCRIHPPKRHKTANVQGICNNGDYLSGMKEKTTYHCVTWPGRGG